MFIIVELIFAVIFVATSFDGKQNVAAVFEWIVAFVFTFYVLTFFIDLLPAARSTQEHSNAELMHLKRAENGGAIMNPAGPTDGMTTDGVNGNAYAVGAAGHDDIGTRQHRARAAQNF